MIDMMDYILWKKMKSMSPSTGAGGESAATPEPTAACLALVAMLLRVAASRRRAPRHA
jgi:hypothetical protein